MRMVYGLMAEFVNFLQPDMRLVIVGVFDGFTVSVASENMPVAVDHHYLTCSIGFSPNEIDVEHQGALKLRDEDGREIMELGPFPIRVKHGRVQGFEVCYNWANKFTDLTVPRCGTYNWEVVVDGKVLGEIPFHVTRGATPTAEQVIQRQPG